MKQKIATIDIWVLTAAAKEWIEAYVGPDAQWFGSQLIVEHRYAAELAAAMQADGLTLR